MRHCQVVFNRLGVIAHVTKKRRQPNFKNYILRITSQLLAQLLNGFLGLHRA